MLRDSKQRLAPVPVRRWALRCGGGLLLGAGICAAAAGTAHADAPGLTEQAGAAVGSILPSTATAAHGTTSAGSASTSSKARTASETTSSVTRSTVEEPARAAASKIVKVIQPKHETGYVGRHRAHAPTVDDVSRSTGRLLGDPLDTAAKISGRLTDVVDRTASGHRGDGSRAGAGVGSRMPASGRLRDAVPELGRLPRVTTPGVGLPRLLRPGLQLPGLELPGRQLPGLQLPGLELPGLELPGLELPSLQLPGLQLPGLQFPAFQLPGLLPHLGRPVPPGVPALSGIPAGPGTGAPAAGPDTLVSAGHPSTLQGLAGTAPSHLSRVALPDAPSAPAAPRGPRPTGPVPALPAGTGAGVVLDQTAPWAETVPATRLTPSGPSILVTGRTGPAPRDLAGMPLITPD